MMKNLKMANMNYKFIIFELEKFKKLEKNWDYFGSDPLKVENIDAAKATWLNILEVYNPSVIPHVVPMSSGNVQFEWHSKKRFLELEFISSEDIIYLKGLRDSDDFEEVCIKNSEIDKIVGLIKEVFDESL